MSVGNLLGSNITDPLLSFGAGALFAGKAVVSPVAPVAILYLIIVSIFIVALFAWRKEITRWSAALLVLLYAGSFFIF